MEVADAAAAPLRLRRKLVEAIAPPEWPDGIVCGRFDAALAEDVHELLTEAYRDGGGSISGFSEWWSAVSSDAEFDPELCFLAQDAAGYLVGVNLCWSSGFIKDLAVRPPYRQWGIDRALLLTSFGALQRRGLAAVDLKVWRNNQTAIRLYMALGMQLVTSP